MSIMQPYFFPYIGHYALLGAVDEWIVFDVTQYKPKTWMNRNRILHPKEGWQYVTVPLANSSMSLRTHEARVQNLDETKKNVIGKLTAFRRHAPFFNEVNHLVQDAFGRTKSQSLCELNVHTLSVVCEYLDLPFSYRVCSDLELSFPDELGPGDWAPFICRELGATEYLNPSGGRALFDQAKFKSMNVSLRFAEFSEFVYDTGPFRYEQGLSIIDVLLWNAPETVATALRSQLQLVEP